MATFVLVHGAGGGSWGYTDVARTLRGHGHEVFAPSLTGLGDKSHLASPTIDLSTHIRDVTNLIEREGLTDIILVGHSYGGMVVTGVAGEMPDRIRSLVYLDAFLPGDGQSLWDIAGEGARTMYIENQRETPGLIAPMSVAVPASGNARPLTHHPLLTLLEPVRTGGREAEAGRRTSIYATRGAPTTFTGFYERVKADPAWRVHDVDSGHVVMSDAPEALVEMLLAEVER
jgi:pimeloyl-ACP methyl ester carboxylesterase